MKWYTHAAIGANAVWLVALIGDVNSNTIMYAALGAFGSLLPDIDTGKDGAKIHHVFLGLFRPFRGLFRHRGFFHSFICVTLLFCLTIPFAYFVDPFFPAILTIGYASHLLIDAWNGGMQYFFPLRKDVSFVPRMLRFRVGSFGDDVFFLLGIFGLVTFILLHWSAFFVMSGVLYS